MISLNHKIYKPERIYELRIENSNGSRVFVSGNNYYEIRNEAYR